MRCVPGRRLSAGSNQKEIDERDQGRSDARRDQGVIGADVALRIERWLEGFLGHFGGLGPAGRIFCEAGHIRGIFFTAWSPERGSGFRIGNGTGFSDAVSGKDRRWVSKFSLSKFSLSKFSLSKFSLSKFSLSKFSLSKFSPGDRETARNYGCRC